MMNSIVLSFTDLQMSDVSNPATHLQQQNTVLFARKRVTLIYVFVKNYLTKKNYLKTQTCLDKQISLPPEVLLFTRDHKDRLPLLLQLLS